MSANSSDSDDIEIDGFPPENANNARFISLKSSCDSMGNQKLYRPISSWSPDLLPLDIVKACILVLKDSSNLCEVERKQILQQLEIHLCHSSDHSIYGNDYSANSPQSSQFVKSQEHKLSAIKVNIQIPSNNANANNIKYGIDQPSYDNDLQCWQTSMNFIIQNEHQAGKIAECSNEVDQENKEVQTQMVRHKSDTLSPTKCVHFRSKSEDRFLNSDEQRISSSDKPIISDADIAVLEKIESSFRNSNEKLSTTTIKVSFRNYSTIIRNSIDAYNLELKKLTHECESLMDLSYNTWTENQFKWHAKNKLFLKDIEKQIHGLDKDINDKIKKMVKYAKSFNDKTKTKIYCETGKCEYVYSVKLVAQMLSTLKIQIIKLRDDVMGKEKKAFFL